MGQQSRYVQVLFENMGLEGEFKPQDIDLGVTCEIIPLVSSFHWLFIYQMININNLSYAKLGIER